MNDTQDWEKVLWRRQVYPDNHVPPRLFLASLQRNRMNHLTIFLARLFNRISSQLSTLFVLAPCYIVLLHHPTPSNDFYFPGDLRRIKRGNFGPSVLSVHFGVTFPHWIYYLERARHPTKEHRSLCQPLVKTYMDGGNPDAVCRSQSFEVIHYDVPGPHVAFTSITHTNCCHIFRLHLGSGRNSLYYQCPPG